MLPFSFAMEASCQTGVYTSNISTKYPVKKSLQHVVSPKYRKFSMAIKYNMFNPNDMMFDDDVTIETPRL